MTTDHKHRELNSVERKALDDLHALAKRWPTSLTLFSWSGSLVVMWSDLPRGGAAIIETVHGIPNDGGDP